MFLIDIVHNRYSRQLWYAVARQNVEKVRDLLAGNHRLNINYDLCGVPILHNAAANNNVPILEALFSSKYAQDINIDITMHDPIHVKITPLDSARLAGASNAETFLKTKGAHYMNGHAPDPKRALSMHRCHRCP